MSVLDIVPNAVSGVYFVYDPAWSALSLGKLSALRETTLAIELQQAGFGETFYMMGELSSAYKHHKDGHQAIYRQ